MIFFYFDQQHSVHCVFINHFSNFFFPQTDPELSIEDPLITDTTITGRVLVDRDGIKGYFCRGWDFAKLSAEGICMMMGYDNGGFLANQTTLPDVDMSM